MSVLLNNVRELNYRGKIKLKGAEITSKKQGHQIIRVRIVEVQLHVNKFQVLFF